MGATRFEVLKVRAVPRLQKKVVVNGIRTPITLQGRSHVHTLGPPGHRGTQHTCLYINYLGKVYEENEWRKHFQTAGCDVTAQLTLKGKGQGREMGKGLCPLDKASSGSFSS